MIFAVIIIFFAVIVECILEKKTRFGSIIPIGALAYMIYDFVVKYSEANFKIIDILFSVLLFVVTIISWIITKKINYKKLLT